MANLSQVNIADLEGNREKNPGYQKTVNLAKTFGAGLHFLEGIPETRVFLTARAAQFQRILENLPSDAANTLAEIVQRVFPQMVTPDLTYISIKKFLTPHQLGAKISRLQGDQSQHFFASGCQLSQGYVSQLESGDIKDPSMRSLQKVADNAGIDLEKLLGIKTIIIPKVVARVDHFFRSPQVSPQEKREAWHALLFLSQILNKSQAVQTVSADFTPIPQPSPS